MRILHILHSRSYGGAETNALVLLRGQKAAGHEVMYAGRHDSWLGRACTDSGIPVAPVRLAGLFDPVSHFRLWRLARTFRPDIIHGHLVRGSFYAGIAGRQSRRPVAVCTAHATTAYKHMGRCARIIAVSRAVERNLLAHGHPASKVAVVYNGMPDGPASARAGIRAELGIPDTVHALVATGRFIRDKGQDVLVAALANCPPQVHLHLIGNPDTEFGRTVAATAKDNPRIHFIGYRNDVQRLLPAFDTFVQGSRREALSLSLIEAAAAGLPAVATAVGGVPEVIADGTTGILVPPEDPAAMGAALWRLVDTPAMGRAMGEAARKRYLEMFTEARMLEGTLAVYRSCLPQAEAGD